MRRISTKGLMILDYEERRDCIRQVINDIKYDIQHGYVSGFVDIYPYLQERSFTDATQSEVNQIAAAIRNFVR